MSRPGLGDKRTSTGPEHKSRNQSSMPPRYYASRRNSEQHDSIPNLRRNAPLARPLLQARVHSAPVVVPTSTNRISTSKATSAAPSLSERERHYLHLPTPNVPDEPSFQPPPNASRQRNVERPLVASTTQPDLANETEDGRIEDSSLPESKDDTVRLRPVEMNVAIVNAADVGQKAFLHQAFDFHGGATSPRRPKTYEFNGNSYGVRLFDLSLADLRFSDDGNIRWPTSRNSMEIPDIQATVLVYDVTKSGSLVPLPNILSALKRSCIPVVLVPSRSVQFASIRTHERDQVEEKARMMCDGVNAFHVSDAQSEIQTRCISVLVLRQVYGHRTEPNGVHPSQSKPVSSFQQPKSPIQSRSRADSKISIRSHSHLGVRNSAATDGSATQSSTSSSDINDVARRAGDLADDLLSRPITPSPVIQPPSTFNELVARLLTAPSTKAEVKYTPVFLAVYRMFAAPSELLQAIILHFHRQGSSSVISGERTSHERDLKTISRWVVSYPGDFAHPSTSQMLRHFLSDATKVDIDLTALTEQIHLDLDVVYADDDTEWACSDSKLQDEDARTKIPIDVPRMSIDVPYTTRMSTSQGRPEKFFNLDDKFNFGSSSTLPGLASPHENQNATTLQPVNSATDALRPSPRGLTPKPLHPLTKSHWHLIMSYTEETIARELTRISSAHFLSLQPRDLLRHATHPSSSPNSRSSTSTSPITILTHHFNHLAHWTSSLILLRDKPKHRALLVTKLMRIARKVRELNDYNTLAALLAGIQGTAVHRLRATWELVSKDVRRDFLKLEVLMASARGNASYRLAWENTRKERGRCPFLAIHQRDLVGAVAGGKTFVDGNGRGDVCAAAAGGTSYKASQAAAGAQESLRHASSLSSPAPLTAPIVSSMPPPQLRLVNWHKFHIIGSILTSLQATPYTPSSATNEELRSLVLDTIIIEDEDELYARSCALEPAVAVGGAAGMGMDGGMRGWVGRLGRGV